MNRVEFELSDIGEGLEEAEIIRWLVEVGDDVQRDQPIVEVMTDKSNAELPAPVAGTIVAVRGAVGDIVHVGETLAVIDPDSTSSHAPIAPPVETAPSTFVATSAATPASTSPVSTFQQASRQPPAEPPGSIPARPKASPATRREAARLGVDITTIAGTGPGGRILMSDLSVTAAAPPTTQIEQPERPPLAQQEDAAGFPVADAAPIAVAAASELDETSVVAAAAPATQAGSTSVPLRGIRRAIAQNMHRSWSQIPHIHSFDHIDAEPLLSLRAQLRDSGRAEFASITPLSLMVAAVRDAMAQFPQANASLDLDAETVTNHSSVNIGFAVAAPAGLLVPVVRDAASLSLPALVLEVRRLVDGARAGTLDRAEFTGGTATITNFGSLGGEQALPLIRPPESVIFGFGSIAPRPFVIDGEVVARKTMHTVLGADHRLLDGDIATGLLTHVTASLTAPINLALGS